MKFSPAGSTVGIALRATAEHLTVLVRDEGIGILPEDRQCLFEPFRRGANVGERPGTGLGLTITKTAVELHGGTIAVQRTIGAGTTFEVTLPMANTG